MYQALVMPQLHLKLSDFVRLSDALKPAQRTRRSGSRILSGISIAGTISAVLYLLENLAEPVQSFKALLE
jgi:hypothetical protein